jgi:hypothetical protein
MKAVAELARIDSAATTITGGTFTRSFKLNTYSVSLLTIRDRNIVAALPQAGSGAFHRNATLACRGDAVTITFPDGNAYDVQMSSMSGRTVVRARASGGTLVCSKKAFTPGAYVMRAVPVVKDAAELLTIAVVK